MTGILPTGNSARVLARGFTLIELLIVLTIMAVLVSSISYLLLNREKSLSRQAGDIVQNLRLMRQRAIREDRPYQVEIDLGNNRLRFPDQVIELRETVSVTVRTTENQVIDSDVAGMTFYPDASSSGGLIKLETDDEVVEILVIWISGKIRMRHQARTG